MYVYKAIPAYQTNNMTKKEKIEQNNNCLRTAEKLFILANKIMHSFEFELEKPACIIVKLNDRYRYRLSRMVHSAFLIKRFLSQEQILPIDTFEQFVRETNVDEEGNFFSLLNLYFYFDFLLLEPNRIIDLLILNQLNGLKERKCSLID